MTKVLNILMAGDKWLQNGQVTSHTMLELGVPGEVSMRLTQNTGKKYFSIAAAHK